MLDSLIVIIVLILSLGLVTFVHELGHLLFAKKYNLYCPEFAVGMGPKLFSFQKGETLYSIRAFPIGGFVRIAGEEDDGSDVAVGRRLFDASKLQQAMVLFAGALFNFILGLVLLLIVNFSMGVSLNSNEIGQVVDNSVASDIGLKAGDEITNINGVVVTSFDEVRDNLNMAIESGDVAIEINNGTTYSFTDVNEDFVLGVNFATTRNVFYVIKSSVTQFVMMFTIIGRALLGLFIDFKNTSGNIAGPVGVYSVLKDYMSYGLVATFLFISTISINIGVFNLLPIPGLDGSKIVIAIGEHITKKDLPRKLYAVISIAGVLFLLALMLLVTIKDIVNL